MLNQLDHISFNRFIPVAVIYLFFNAAGMPEGVLITTLLTPFFIYDNIRQGLNKPILYFFLITGLWSLWHLFIGIHVAFYSRSWLMAFCNFQFCLSVYLFFKKEDAIASVFRTLIYVNVLFLIVAITFRFVPSLKPIMWYMVPVSPGLPAYPRLKLLTSEASIYSLMITPLFMYAWFHSIASKNKAFLFALITLLIAFVLSFSLGVLACVALALIITATWHRKFFFGNKAFNRMLLAFCLITFVVAVFYLIHQPNNLLYARLKNILHGDDTSARGRTYESFILAWRMIHDKSVWFGIGLGQIKEYGRSIVLEYYRYTGVPQTIRIPNSAAETLIYYGVFGLIFKLAVEVYLFFRCQVKKDPLRLSLFVFMFIYQFTGSYFTNLAEYVIWIMAFTSLSFNLNAEKR